jgi:ABC-type lipoprotein release transport system permease subunit
MRRISSYIFSSSAFMIITILLGVMVLIAVGNVSHNRGQSEADTAAVELKLDQQIAVHNSRQAAFRLRQSK